MDGEGYGWPGDWMGEKADVALLFLARPVKMTMAGVFFF